MADVCHNNNMILSFHWIFWIDDKCGEFASFKVDFNTREWTGRMSKIVIELWPTDKSFVNFQLFFFLHIVMNSYAITMEN